MKSSRWLSEQISNPQFCFVSNLLSFSSLSSPKRLSSSSSQWFSALRYAISASNLGLGMCIHARILASGEFPDRFLSNNLIAMYGKCGYLPYARLLFDKTPERDLVTWNSILAAYAQSVDSGIEILEEFFCLFRLLRRYYVSTSKMTLAPVLKLCLFSGYNWASEAVHGYALKIGLGWDEFVAGALVNIYAKFGRIREAQVLFEEMQDRDVVLWNVMLKAYLDRGLDEEALTFFRDFHRSGLCPDNASVRRVLRDVSDVDRGVGRRHVEQIRAYGIKLLGHENSLNIVSLNKALSNNVQAGKNFSAIECFLNMIRSDVAFDSVTLVVVFAAVNGLGNFRLGQQVHGMVLKSGYDSDIAVANSIVNMYSKIGNISLAQKVFSAMEELDLISWNSMISGFAQSQKGKEAVNVFIDLLENGLRPDNFTLASVLKACYSLAECLSLTEQIHVQVIKTGNVSDSFVSTALIDVYSRNGRMSEAELLFRNKGKFDLASWNAMMSGYISSDNSQKALELFQLMLAKGSRIDEITVATVAKACGCLLAMPQGVQMHAYALKLGFKSDLFLASSILDMYVKCGDMAAAHLLFNNILEPDDVAWTTMISGCIGNGDEDRALFVYHQMRESGVQPDEYTLATLVKASSYLTALEQGRQLHANIIKLDCVSDPYVGTSLIDMYAKCGNIEDAYFIFKQMELNNIALWNAMLVGLAQHGNGEEALNLFKLMKSHNIQPDRVTFIGVISACSHSGLVSEAYEHFYAMQQNYGIKPQIEHYSCLVDALGRAGHLKEAEELISSMPFEASASMYRALLGACRVQGEIEIGKRVANKVLALEPSDSAAYILLSNMYATSNRWDDMTDARKAMRVEKVKKDPGFSWVDNKNKVHLFVVDDRSHPLSSLIYEKLEDIMRRIKEGGYAPDTEFVLLDVEQEEKERALYHHSEKLAIAFALMSTPSTSIIRVIKNLRVCGDCHNAIKHISKVFAREIVVRDANRFHRFKSGMCSCGDYWLGFYFLQVFLIFGIVHSVWSGPFVFLCHLSCILYREFDKDHKSSNKKHRMWTRNQRTLLLHNLMHT